MLSQDTRTILRSICPTRRDVAYGYLAGSLCLLAAAAFVCGYCTLGGGGGCISFGLEYLGIFATCLVLAGMVLFGRTWAEYAMRKRINLVVEEAESEDTTEQQSNKELQSDALGRAP